MPALPDAKSQAVRLLREQLRQTRLQRRKFQPSGSALDRVLPGGGIPYGGIVEWLGGTGSGAAELSLHLAARICQAGKTLAVVDSRCQLYPPAMAGRGIELNRVLLVHPQSRRDEVWAMVQCLRCPSISMVWGCPQKLDAREYRCLQLAAETGGAAGMFVRPPGIAGRPTWADAQLLVTPQAAEEHRRFVVKVVNCRQGIPGKLLSVEMDAITGERRECDEPFPMRLASQLADPSSGRSAARA